MSISPLFTKNFSQIFLGAKGVPVDDKGQLKKLYTVNLERHSSANILKQIYRFFSGSFNNQALVDLIVKHIGNYANWSEEDKQVLAQGYEKFEAGVHLLCNGLGGNKGAVEKALEELKDKLLPSKTESIEVEGVDIGNLSQLGNTSSTEQQQLQSNGGVNVSTNTTLADSDDTSLAEQRQDSEEKPKTNIPDIAAMQREIGLVVPKTKALSYNVADLEKAITSRQIAKIRVTAGVDLGPKEKTAMVQANLLGLVRRILQSIDERECVKVEAKIVHAILKLREQHPKEELLKVLKSAFKFSYPEIFKSERLLQLKA